MIRVFVVVEGTTEERFVGDVLAPALWPRQTYLEPRILGRPGHKGGNTKYTRVRKDIVTQLKQDKRAYCTTMIDFYGLGSGFPGTPLPLNLSSLEKVRRIEQAVKADIASELADIRADIRLLPYLQLHEYEALLFSDPNAFANNIGQPHLAARFHQIRQPFATPEDINNNPNTAPSKQVRGAYPAYRKVLDGLLAAKSVGINSMRHECTHFREWIESLEALAVNEGGLAPT